MNMHELLITQNKTNSRCMSKIVVGSLLVGMVYTSSSVSTSQSISSINYSVTGTPGYTLNSSYNATVLATGAGSFVNSTSASTSKPFVTSTTFNSGVLTGLVLTSSISTSTSKLSVWLSLSNLAVTSSLAKSSTLFSTPVSTSKLSTAVSQSPVASAFTTAKSQYSSSLIGSTVTVSVVIPKSTQIQVSSSLTSNTSAPLGSGSLSFKSTTLLQTASTVVTNSTSSASNNLSKSTATNAPALISSQALSAVYASLIVTSSRATLGSTVLSYFSSISPLLSSQIVTSATNVLVNSLVTSTPASSSYTVSPTSSTSTNMKSNSVSANIQPSQYPTSTYLSFGSIARDSSTAILSSNLISTTSTPSQTSAKLFQTSSVVNTRLMSSWLSQTTNLRTTLTDSTITAPTATTNTLVATQITTTASVTLIGTTMASVNIQPSNSAMSTDSSLFKTGLFSTENSLTTSSGTASTTSSATTDAYAASIFSDPTYPSQSFASNSNAGESTGTIGLVGTTPSIMKAIGTLMTSFIQTTEVAATIRETSTPCSYSLLDTTSELNIASVSTTFSSEIAITSFDFETALATAQDSTNAFINTNDSYWTTNTIALIDANLSNESSTVIDNVYISAQADSTKEVEQYYTKLSMADTDSTLHFNSDSPMSISEDYYPTTSYLVSSVTSSVDNVTANVTVDLENLTSTGNENLITRTPIINLGHRQTTSKNKISTIATRTVLINTPNSAANVHKFLLIWMQIVYFTLP